MRELLESGRNSLRSQFDPLPLEDMNGTDPEWWITNTVMRGLSNYSIHHLHIVDADRSALRVEFNASWPALAIAAHGRLRYCRKILGKEHCFKLSGKPRISVKDPAGRLVTLLDVKLKNGKLQVNPRDTNIVINLSHIAVEMRLDGILGLLDKFLGFPSKIYASRLTNVWWKTEKKIIEDYVKIELHDLVKYVSPRLAVLLQGFTG